MSLKSLEQVAKRDLQLTQRILGAEFNPDFASMYEPSDAIFLLLAALILAAGSVEAAEKFLVEAEAIPVVRA